MNKVRQAGFALVVAMLIVAIAAVVASQIFYRQQVNVRRSLNQLQSERLYQLFLSSEEWNKVILQQDLLANKIDTFKDNWAQPLNPFPAENALVKTRLSDQQSCFNINNLVLNGKASQEQITILQNLMRQLRLNPNLIWALVDWLDSDDEPYPEGAEWETYSRLKPSYRAANFRITELSELYAVLGWNTQIIHTLSPYICALPPAPAFNQNGRYFFKPTDKFTPLNINTAAEILLRSLSKPMQDANLSALLAQQKTTGFKSVDEFLTQLDKNNAVKEGQPKLSASFKKEFISVDSQYFSFAYSGWIDELELYYRSLIYRDNTNKKLYTLYRVQDY